MFAASEESTSRSTLMRKIGGYGAAIAVTPYLLIKIAWTFGMFLPNESMGDPNWRAINATTAMLALIVILLAMAFSRPWGERLPALFALALVRPWGRVFRRQLLLIPARAASVGLTVWGLGYSYLQYFLAVGRVVPAPEFAAQDAHPAAVWGFYWCAVFLEWGISLGIAAWRTQTGASYDSRKIAQ